MEAREIRDLMEAYSQVYENQEQLDEGKSSRPRYPGGRGVLDQERRDEKREASAENMRGHTAGPGTVTKNPKKLRKQKAMGEIEEGVDLFDYLLEYLVAEGYADTNKAALAIMANMSEEWRQDIMEISQKTATRAYAASSTGEFEGQDSPRDVKRTNNLRKHIQRKFGDKAAKHADRAAHSMTFGRKSSFIKMPPKP